MKIFTLVYWEHPSDYSNIGDCLCGPTAFASQEAAYRAYMSYCFNRVCEIFSSCEDEILEGYPALSKVALASEQASGLLGWDRAEIEALSLEDMELIATEYIDFVGDELTDAGYRIESATLEIEGEPSLEVPEKGKLSGAEYVARNGWNCPFCESEEISSYGPADVAGDIAFLRCDCRDCREEWSDIYVLNGYEPAA